MANAVGLVLFVFLCIVSLSYCILLTMVISDHKR